MLKINLFESFETFGEDFFFINDYQILIKINPDLDIFQIFERTYKTEENVTTIFTDNPIYTYNIRYFNKFQEFIKKLAAIYQKNIYLKKIVDNEYNIPLYYEIIVEKFIGEK